MVGMGGLVCALTTNFDDIVMDSSFGVYLQTTNVDYIVMDSSYIRRSI